MTDRENITGAAAAAELREMEQCASDLVVRAERAEMDAERLEDADLPEMADALRAESQDLHRQAAGLIRRIENGNN